MTLCLRSALTVVQRCAIALAMIRSISRKPLQLMAALPHLTSVSEFPLSRCCRSLISQLSGNLSPLLFPSSSSSSAYRWFSNDSAATRCSELTRLPTLLEGCDYKHWLVVMEPPKGYPLRDEIVHEYVKTLAIALGSEEEAKKSIYSVSTKYYYAFGCKIPETLTYKIKSLPNVRWVLPDSYLCHGENDYGGEPFVNGEVLPYEEKYHADWLRDQNNDKYKNKTRLRKSKRKERK